MGGREDKNPGLAESLYFRNLDGVETQTWGILGPGISRFAVFGRGNRGPFQVPTSVIL
jgi:hypothetical protein